MNSLGTTSRIAPRNSKPASCRASCGANPARRGFVLAASVLLLLSQAPRFGIDIPPVRALFYSVIPLSITAAYLLSVVWGWPLVNHARRLLRLALVVLLIVSSYFSLRSAFTLSHTVRTNATLTAEQLPLLDFLDRSSAQGGALIDDYNRRSASWLILAGRPTYSRIATDIEQQMNEARQSPQRRALYLNQLDFEKIYSLGSLPLIAELMEKHNIAYLTGIEGSSDTAFQHNPLLTEVARGGDIILRESTEGTNLCGGGVGGERAERAGDKRRTNCVPEGLGSWLLAPTTLANDIGDREDTFEHLPASLRATRLSASLTDGGRTYRVTSAPLIPLRFNIGDYVRVLWEEGAQEPEHNVDVLIAAVSAAPLTVSTPAGKSYDLPGAVSLLRIPAHEVPLDEKGFITMTLHNPAETPVEIDLIAIGLSHTP